MKTLVLASNNKHKIKELKEIFPPEYSLITAEDAGFCSEILETGQTFYENALIKAKTVSLFLGVDAISDDSGLVVEALNGKPGVYSARYSGVNATAKENNDLLLRNLEGEKNRKAEFHSCILIHKKNGEIISGYGKTSGKILYQPNGNNGFGYDPIFFSDDLKKSFGEATDDEKNSVSHRKRAIIDLLGHLLQS